MTHTQLPVPVCMPPSEGVCGPRPPNTVVVWGGEPDIAHHPQDGHRHLLPRGLLQPRPSGPPPYNPPTLIPPADVATRAHRHQVPRPPRGRTAIIPHTHTHTRSHRYKLALCGFPASSLHHILLRKTWSRAYMREPSLRAPVAGGIADAKLPKFCITAAIITGRSVCREARN